MLNERQIKNYKRDLEKNTRRIEKGSKLFDFLADPTRLKILLLIKGSQGLCVTDFSQILGISISAVSHQLSALERAGIVKREKEGQTVCYRLARGKMILNCLTCVSKDKF